MVRLQQRRLGRWPVEAAEAIWKRVESTITADSGAGGLNNFTDTNLACLRGGYVRSDDAAIMSDTNYPYLVVAINTRDLSPFTTTDLHDCVVEMTLIGDRDQGAGWGVMSRALGRLDTVFQNTAMSSLTDTDDGAKTWTFAKFGRTTPTQYPATGKVLRRALRFRTLATRT